MRKILILLTLLFWAGSFVIGSSMQDSQTGFRNITRTPDVTADISGTANQVIVTDNGDGTITLSTPQDIDATATPTFAGVELTANVLWTGANRATRYFSDLLANKADSSASGTVTIIGDHDGTGNKDYDRVSSGDAAQAGVIVKKWRVPENFSAWTGSASVSIWTRSSDFANCTFVVTMEDGSGNVDGTISGSDIAPGSDNTWAETTLEPGSAVTPGETIRLIFTATNADADDTSDLGSDVLIGYLASN